MPSFGADKIAVDDLGRARVINEADEPGHDVAFDRMWGGGLAKKVSLSADGQVGVAGPCVYYGYLVTTALGAGVINVRDAAAAGAGDIVDIIAASAAVGVDKRLPVGIYCPAGVYADFASTGTVTFFYQQL
jgi:hypothetical protein